MSLANAEKPSDDRIKYHVEQMRKQKKENNVSYLEYADIVRMSYSTLMNWNNLFDEHMQKIKLCGQELRGGSNHIGYEVVGDVIGVWDGCDDGIKKKVSEFSQYYNRMRKNFLYERGHKKIDRKTITDCLMAHGRYKPKSRKAYEGARNEFKKYYPGAQSITDGKQIKVDYLGQEYKFNLEFNVDVFSTYITGHDVSDTEDTAVVNAVWGQDKLPLGILSDNGSGNTSGEAKDYLAKNKVIDMNIYPRHPQTDGLVEGIFGKYEELVGKIKIVGTTMREIARSIASSVAKTFVSCHNYMPKKGLNNLTPYDVHRSYRVSEEEVRRAKEGLTKQCQRSKRLRQKKQISPEKRYYIEKIIAKYKFDVDLEKAVKVLGKYDDKVIGRADNKFYVYLNRDNFDMDKNTFAYFCGIVKNMQKETDEEIIKNNLSQKYADKQAWLEKQQQLEALRQERELDEEIKNNPEKVILDYSRQILDCRFKTKMYDEPIIKSMDNIKKTRIDAIEVLERLYRQINLWCEYSPDRRQMVIYQLKQFANNGNNIK